MRKIIVKVDKEKATELERVNFELNFVKDIVQRVIESHPSDLELINGDTLMSYNKRGAELQRKYAALANEMEKEYIPECLEGHQYSWIIPNNSDEMTITTDECFYCPIAAGCSNCSGYDYQVNGTPDSKATYICVMHKARALGNLYFWNKYYRKNNMNKRMKNYVPDEWALEIISESELNMLKELERED